jgi:hypothetical protein
MEKFLLTIEFRYKEIPKSDIFSEHKSKIITIGVFDDVDNACLEGNKLMENLEGKFPLHVFPNGKGSAKKERFSKNGGCFGSKNNLITNLAYLKTPFEFYAKIETLKMEDIEETIEGVVDSIKKYREHKTADVD